jgi:hypothetical protein
VDKATTLATRLGDGSTPTELQSARWMKSRRGEDRMVADLTGKARMEADLREGKAGGAESGGGRHGFGRPAGGDWD